MFLELRRIAVGSGNDTLAQHLRPVSDIRRQILRTLRGCGRRSANRNQTRGSSKKSSSRGPLWN
jgi:hypothetical protein